jgi:uncharacterized protein (TIGR02246 family)
MNTVGAAGAVVLACVVGACATPRDDADAVRAALTAFSRDFNGHDVTATCGLFADDTVVSYPGRPPKGHTEVCEGFRAVFANPAMSFRYDEPAIREILVDGDLATVALTWTLTVADSSGRVLETTREDGVDVLRRQPDGHWRIHISHAFPVEAR